MRIYIVEEEENQESESKQVNNDKATKQGSIMQGYTYVSRVCS